MSFWESSVFLSIVSVVVGIIVSTFFFWLSKTKKQLEYQKGSTHLVTKHMANIPGISISLDGQQVATVISTTVKFINTQTILIDDFAALEPLSISVTGQFFNMIIPLVQPTRSTDSEDQVVK